ncbi:protein APCDD1-like [Neolamprologus brichardi]|uniref:protein APCDD1-like n=1 Tax=Neolamprologus brichardi TaxID=32507 RepID=UPI0003EC66DF|nr:protein APCDD1-like [Neolamprologus brichardi]
MKGAGAGNMSSGRFSHLLRGVWFLWQALLVVGTGTKLWEVPTGPFASSSNFSESLQWEPHCQYHNIQDRVRITADIPPQLDGTWVSIRCEVRPGPEFLTRSYTFHPNRHFQALQHYYTDTKLLNSTKPGKCGRATGWEVGVEQDLTPTDGCTVLGIKLPHKEYELFKIELDHRKHPLLFIGERPTDGSSPDRPLRRPTSFQAPMVLCSGGSTQAARSGFNSKQVQLAASGTERLPQLVLLVFGSVLCGWLCVY